MINSSFGKATRPSGDHPICDTQRGENYQAVDPHPPRFNPVRRTRWFDSWPILAVIGWVVAGAFWMNLPAWVRVGCIVATPIVAVAALVAVWRSER